MAITEVRDKPVVRRVGRLVVTLTGDGLSLRRKSAQSSRSIKWARLVYLVLKDSAMPPNWTEAEWADAMGTFLRKGRGKKRVG